MASVVLALSLHFSGVPAKCENVGRPTAVGPRAEGVSFELDLHEFSFGVRLGQLGAASQPLRSSYSTAASVALNRVSRPFASVSRSASIRASGSNLTLGAAPDGGDDVGVTYAQTSETEIGSHNDFSNALQSKGFVLKRGTGGARHYHGLRLRLGQ
jgi:hypothetical protein